MRPCLKSPLRIRGVEFGGANPLFCVPLVAKGLGELIDQAHVAHGLKPDVVEWRADANIDLTAEAAVEAARQLRSALDSELIVFTLRIRAEGGLQELSQTHRAQCIDAVLRAGLIDIVDVEMCNGPGFLDPIIKTAHAHGAHVVLSFHDFKATPGNEALLDKITAMVGQGADIAKIACMPQDPEDVLRLLQVTLAARKAFPDLPLCTMSMAGLGCLTRVAGFLYGSDMAFAVGQEVSAPGQLPLAEARAMTQTLLRNA
jgi:3-dehydroquinate dehydratase-1